MFEKIKNRAKARKEHKNMLKNNMGYILNFNAELSARIEYKKRLLLNELVEVGNLNPDDMVDIMQINNFIDQQKEHGKLDLFYNKVNC